MDKKEEILNLLQDNARLSVSDISAMTKISEKEVSDIISAAEKDGTIMKYATILNPERTTSGSERISAEIEIQVNP